MSQKLTGREAVIALMDGKKVINGGAIFYFTDGRCLSRYSDGTISERSLDEVFSYGNWTIVPEPMVYESETVVGGEYDFEVSVQVPKKFNGKRVKVRVEEIL